MENINWWSESILNKAPVGITRRCETIVLWTMKKSKKTWRNWILEEKALDTILDNPKRERIEHEWNLFIIVSHLKPWVQDVFIDVV